MLKKLFNRKPSDTPVIDSNVIPKHVAIIMDGNGRWAKRRGMPRSMGHRAGADVLKQIVIAACLTLDPSLNQVLKSYPADC